MKTCELWTHGSTGDVYAFCLDDGHLTACCGPLTLEQMATGDLAESAYEELPEAVRRVADGLAPFTGVEAWLSRQSVVSRVGAGRSVVARALERVAARRRARRQA